MKNFTNLMIGLVFIIALSGCDDPQAGKTKINQFNSNSPQPAPVAEKPRFDVTSHGIFYGGYNNNAREIFIVKDLENDKEYMVITGAGVSEIIRKRVGKTIVDREE